LRLAQLFVSVFPHPGFPQTFKPFLLGFIFYRIGLMGTLPGVLIVHLLGTIMYGVIHDFPATAGAVFSIILIIPNLLLLILMRKYVGPETLNKGYKMK
jgi:putative spermidine/putrescine transport system permease protein